MNRLIKDVINIRDLKFKWKNIAHVLVHNLRSSDVEQFNINMFFKDGTFSRKSVYNTMDRLRSRAKGNRLLRLTTRHKPLNYLLD